MSTMSIIFVKLFLLGRFKAGDFASGGIGVCKQILSIVDNIGGGRYYLHAL